MSIDATDPELAAVVERQKIRYRLLRALYRVSESNTLQSLSLAALADHEGINPVQARTAHQYLYHEGLIKFAGSGPTLPVHITHAGVVEVEQSIQHPDRPTAHFMVQVIQHFHGAVGAVQNAPSAVASVTQDRRKPEDNDES